MSQPIFLIAFPRSGSTWISTVMGWAPGAVLNLEPLRMASDRGVRELRPWHFCGAEERSLTEERVLSRALARAAGSRLVIKLVHGCFKAERFAKRFGAKIVLLRREPLGQISSWVRDKTFSVYSVHKLLKRIIQQEAVRERFLDVCNWATHWRQCGNSYELMAAWWSVLEALYLYYVKQHNWLLVYYEDFCESPVPEFRALFAECGLVFDHDVSRKLNTITVSRRSVLGVRGTICRNSRGMLGAGERRLTNRQQRQIKDVVLSFVELRHDV